ncbi:S8 family peptidase [Flammeovirga sp. SJP92]|uniref:S8 family peptidase n=1 Tax=Flammeovirga sp. SJP92 TaxID=1775430 RepID=UPI000786BF2D|nr:S8 family peptidase [Flammeovirga sp. SJP92]KXX67383.1 hypothetical protein AVL50_27185 [Flammeovirga sp. SJP92]
MKNSIIRLVILLCLGLTIYSCSVTKDEQIIEDQLDQDLTLQVEDNYVVMLKQDLSSARTKNISFSQRQVIMKGEAEAFVSEFSLPSSSINRVYGGVFNGFSLKISSQAILNSMKNDPRVLSIEKDQIFTLAKPTVGGVSTSSTQSTPWGITRIGGSVAYTGSNVAYVMDTGIDLDHPDLNVEESLGFNAFTWGRDSRSLDDGNGHGTHVAGTIAALDNGFGVIGVAAGAKVVPVKVLNSRGSGSYSGIIAAIDFIGANGQPGDVANLSLGGGANSTLDQAVVRAAAFSGVKFILAAGNESQNANNVSPARANGSNVYTISASDINDNFAYFSNYGSPVDWCAPGVNILSTTPNGTYSSFSGTSMAAPHAAGVYLVGSAKSSGTVRNDPDGNPDPIISR